MFSATGKGPECERVSSLLSLYLDGLLSPTEAERVQTHLAACPVCAEELKSLGETVALLRLLPTLPVPRSFALTVSPVPVPTRWFFFLRAATAATATCLVAVLMLIAMLPGGVAPSTTLGPAAQVTKTVETPAASAGAKSTASPEGQLAPRPTPAPLPTQTLEPRLVIQPASAPPEEPVETQAAEVSSTPTARATIAGPLAAQGGPAVWHLREIAYGLLGGLIGLGGATGVVWGRERRRH